MKRITLLILILLIGACTGVASRTPIEIATIDYVERHSPVNRVHVTIQAIDGDYACVTVTPSPRDAADRAWAFLEHSKGKWRVLMLGTSFSNSDYRKFKIPPSLWLH